MTETPPDPHEDQAEKAEKQAVRRRWLTIGELVAVAGVVIAGLTFWNGWSERRDAAATRAAEQAAAQAEAEATRRRVGLIATDAGGDTLAFKGVECALQATDIRFPPSLGVEPQFTVTVHAFQADWIARPLLTLTDGGPDRRRGRLPVLIESRCDGAGGPRLERAIYDLVWEIKPGLFGRSLKLRGLILREDKLGTNVDARLNALWDKPAAQPGG
jgi:hypothetical protein